MSRVGQKPISIPSGVTITVSGRDVSVKGPKGQLSLSAHPDMSVSVEGSEVVVSRPSDARRHRSLHGLTRSLVANMVEGVTEGFVKVLEVRGVGYRAEVSGSTLTLNVGYSNPVAFELPKGVSVDCERRGQDTIIKLQGIDKQLVGETAARIRRIRKPEPYKGKGIRYQDEYVRTKAGKTAV